MPLREGLRSHPLNLIRFVPAKGGALNDRTPMWGIEPVPEREAGEVIEDAGEAPAKVVEFLKKAKVI